ncbi:MAG: dethiobiotin synthase [Gammaproteobacteria bacterium]|nr:dethiobiotin synthase [Gammaproteobacteria bacterium]
MTKTFFIAGTDTNIGKTTVTLSLINYLQNQNKTVLGLKPIATGGYHQDQNLLNSDAVLLQQASNLKPLYQHVNPYCFLPPVSPHIINQNFTARDLSLACTNNINIYQPDYCLIEGAGGWLCPLNNTETMADLAVNLNIPIILVIGLKLGCLNHSLLTAEAIKHKQLKLHGWIANCLAKNIDDFAQEDNITYLNKNISAPCLGKIDYLDYIDYTDYRQSPVINIQLPLIL